MCVHAAVDIFILHTQYIILIYKLWLWIIKTSILYMYIVPFKLYIILIEFYINRRNVRFRYVLWVNLKTPGHHSTKTQSSISIINNVFVIWFISECSKNDKATFVSNLIRIFRTEYNREQYAALISGKSLYRLLFTLVRKSRSC